MEIYQPSTDSGFSFTSALTVCVDFKSPQSYLAVTPSIELEKEFDLHIDWQPFLVPSMTPPKPQAENEDRGTQHRRMRAEYYEQDLRRYAGARNLTMENLYRNTDSSTAAVGLLWAKRYSDDVVSGYVRQVFDRYWDEQFDLEDPFALGSLLDELGAEGENFIEYLAGEGSEELEERQTALREAGIFNVPGYVVEGEIFYGRAHLPMIRWLLSGGSGPGPI